MSTKNTPETPADLFKSSARNWSEDFFHENGNYLCSCSTCGESFLGHKRRVECRECANKEPETPTQAINDGGPAFPTDAQEALRHDHYEGMSLRDYFAAKALLVVAPAAIDFNYSDKDGCYFTAKQAYMMADAMLAAREARK